MKNVIKNAINMFVKLCNKRAVEAGWYMNPTTGRPEDRDVGEMLRLIYSEAGEVLKWYRLMDNRPHRRMIEAELADVIIRIADLAGNLDLDLGRAVMERFLYTRIRERLDAR